MRRLLFSAVVFLLVSGAGPAARAELKPNQVAILAMAESEVSRELAQYYAQVRGIPESHILLLDGKVEQRITRYRWDHTLRPAIRKWFKKDESLADIRCFATMWDVPLQIAALDAKAPEITERVAYLRQARATFIGQAGTLFRMLRSNGKEAGASEAVAAPSADIPLEQLHDQFVVAMKTANSKLKKARSTEDRRKVNQFVERALVTISGNHGLMQMAKSRSKSSGPVSKEMARFAYFVGRSEGLRRGMQSLGSMRGTIARDQQAIEMTQLMGGLFGVIRWIDQQLYLLEKNLTEASFDSELSMVLWPDPPVLSWIPNPWHYRFDARPSRRQTTLFVSRLSAPLPDIVRRMIDGTIAAEKTSLQGVVYLDARALAYDPKKPDDGAFGQYDQSLRDLDARLRKHTKLKVVLDNEPDLFGASRCPQAALYCGWHSPGNYRDAFDWSTGAVGYHLADDEAAWLQLNDDNRVMGKKPWCPWLLIDGACATLGSCREAHLVAFPLPDDFFPLLLTGKYSLAEVYYRTCPFLSWTVVLVGDPLYNPYKNSPALSEEALPDRMKPPAARKPGPDDQAGGEPPETVVPGKGRPRRPQRSKESAIVLPGLEQ